MFSFHAKFIHSLSDNIVEELIDRFPKTSSILRCSASARFFLHNESLFVSYSLNYVEKRLWRTTRIQDQNNSLSKTGARFALGRPRSPYKADRSYELPNKMYSTMKKVGLVDRKTKRKVKNCPLGPRAPYARAIRSFFHLLVFKEKNLISRNINATKEGSFNRKMELTTLQPMGGNWFFLKANVQQLLLFPILSQLLP